MMGVKQYKPPIKGTLVCHFCGCTNHSDGLKETSFFRLDGIMGDGACWNLVKNVLIDLGLATEKTLMKDVMQIITKTRRHILENGLRDELGRRVE